MGFFISFLAFGLLMLIFGILMLVKRKKFISNSKVIKGTVIDVKKGYSKGNTYYYPIIEYYDEKLQTKENFRPINGYRSPKHKKGDSVELRYYNNGSKKELQLNTWSQLWSAIVLLIAFGALDIIIALLSRI